GSGRRSELKCYSGRRDAGKRLSEHTGALQMNFAAETEAPETSTQKGEAQIVERTERGENTVTTVYETQHQTPKTGDTAPLLILSALMLFSGIVLLVFAVLYFKKHRRSGEGGLQS